jgi:tagaturonate reductase
LEHQWLSITLQYSMKMRMRNIPILINYYKEFNTVPHYFARGFAAYLLFMKAVKVENGKYFGQLGEEFYPIQCDSANYFYEIWQDGNTNQVVQKTLSNTDLWGVDLTTLKGFADSIATHLSNMRMIGTYEVAANLNVYA